MSSPGYLTWLSNSPSESAMIADEEAEDECSSSAKSSYGKDEDDGDLEVEAYCEEEV